MERALGYNVLDDMVMAYKRHYNEHYLNPTETAKQLKLTFEKYYKGSLTLLGDVKIWEYTAKNHIKLPVFVIKFRKNLTNRTKFIFICYNLKKKRWDFYRIKESDYNDPEITIFYDNFIERMTRDR